MSGRASLGLVVASLLVGSAGRAGAETLDGKRIIIIDGDTVALPCEHLAPGCAEKIRLTAIDAPESYRPTCEAELKAGLRAKERLGELLRAGPVDVLRSGQLDRYGRTLGDLITTTGDAGSILLKEGLALPYRPGRPAGAARIAHWCK